MDQNKSLSVQVILAIYGRFALYLPRKGSVDMKHLVDLEFIASNANEDAILDVLYKHACELKLAALTEAIELYWQSRADQLTVEEYSEAQEQSIKEQFSGEYND